MDLDLAGKTAIITGGSKGIGKACADSLAAEGVNLHITSRTKADLEAAREDILSRHKVDVQIHALDLSKSANQKKLAQATGATAGKVDILINNAGAIPAGNLTKVDEDTWRDAWDLKVFGFVNLSRLIYPAMVERGGGVILNVVGTAGERPAANYICGSTGNAALFGFTRALGQMSLDSNVRVLAIAPGQIVTERLYRQQRLKAEETLGDPERWQEMLKALPQGRAGKPEECGDVVAFLVSKRAFWINGVVIPVDGGGYLR